MRFAPTVLLPLLTIAFAQARDIPPATGPVPVRFGTDIELSRDLPSSLVQREPTIAANPKNRKNLVAGFFGRITADGNPKCWFASTLDAGSTWTFGGATPLGTSFDGCADPALAADARGNFYFAYIDGNVTAQASDIRVAKSTDGGRTFRQSVVVVAGGTTSGTPLPDKDYLVVDNQPMSPHNGTIYLTYTDFPTSETFIKVSVSRDGGRTWSTPAILDSFNSAVSGTLNMTSPVVAPDGVVYVFYMKFRYSSGRASLRFVSSTDGGRTWGPPAEVAADLPTPGFFLLNDGDPGFGMKSGSGFGAISYPTAAIAPDGTIAVAWTDFPNGSCTQADPVFGYVSCVDADVRLSVSRDGGASWTSPVKVSDDAGTSDQFFPWMAAGPDGLMSLFWLDRRLDPNNVNYDAFYTNTADGRNFLPNLRISSATSLVDSTYSGGDYNNLTVTAEGVFAIWNDSRSGTNRIFTAKGLFVP